MEINKEDLQKAFYKWHEIALENPEDYIPFLEDETEKYSIGAAEQLWDYLQEK